MQPLVGMGSVLRQGKGAVRQKIFKKPKNGVKNGFIADILIVVYDQLFNECVTTLN